MERRVSNIWLSTSARGTIKISRVTRLNQEESWVANKEEHECACSRRRTDKYQKNGW